jgi:NADH:ubiquinone oxidoreductase subunit H
MRSPSYLMLNFQGFHPNHMYIHCNWSIWTDSIATFQKLFSSSRCLFYCVSFSVNNLCIQTLTDFQFALLHLLFGWNHHFFPSITTSSSYPRSYLRQQACKVLYFTIWARNFSPRIRLIIRFRISSEFVL